MKFAGIGTSQGRMYQVGMSTKITRPHCCEADLKCVDTCKIITCLYICRNHRERQLNDYRYYDPTDNKSCDRCSKTPLIIAYALDGKVYDYPCFVAVKFAPKGKKVKSEETKKRKPQSGSGYAATKSRDTQREFSKPEPSNKPQKPRKQSTQQPGLF